MIVRILLGVFYLSGWHIFSTCPLRQYHSVAGPLNWPEALTYCREKYTDLATIENQDEMNQLINTVPSFEDHSEVWIGLYSNLNWRWSDGYGGSGAEYRNWGDSEPNFNPASKSNCILLGQSWVNYSCSLNFPFICNNGTQQDPEFVLVSKKMNWSSAQKYCREKFRDLATVRNDTENQKIQVMSGNGTQSWIGLYRDTNSYWSDWSGSSFRYWEGASIPVSVNAVCGLAAMKNSGKWRFSLCDDKLPFVCYSVPVMRKKVVKLKMKLRDSSVDLNDSAVKADILKKLQDRLEEKGVTGVTLKWRQQPDGTDFYKEGKPLKRKSKKTEL